jgi:DNA polymerase elongation subunit (family B)
MRANNVNSNPQIRPTTAKGAKSRPAASSDFAQNAQNIAKKLTRAKVSDDSLQISSTISQPATQAASAKSAVRVSKEGEIKFHQPIYFAKSVLQGYISEPDIKACKELFQIGVKTA